MPVGTLYGLGLGPGDPELITLKALRILRTTAVIAYPAPDTGASFARSIVARWLRPDQREIAIRVPMLPERFPAQRVYDHAADQIATHLGDGQDVALLCQGDPFFYGSFIYLFERLAPRFPVEIVPGVSSLSACAAASREPLVRRDECLTILPATMEETELEARLRAGGAAAIIKLGRHFAKVRAVLRACGLLERARYIERASLKEQRVVADLTQIAPDTVPYFAMILVTGAQR